MATRIDHAAPRIFQTLESLPHPVLRQHDLRGVLEGHRRDWNLALSVSLTRFTDFLIRSGKLTRITLNLRDRPETLYVWGDVSPLTIAVSVKPNAYLCQQTAMVLHGLTDREPQAIYVNDEQRPLPPPEGPLVQRAIDTAFRRRQRITKNHARMGNHTVWLLNGKHTGRLGVITVKDPAGRPLKVTGIERTLIDATVRPFYAGGVADVMEGFRRAYQRFSEPALAAMLEQMEFVYPYRQAVGFYLERTGRYAATDIELFRSPPFEHDFYLCHAMGKRAYSSDWRLYFPEDL